MVRGAHRCGRNSEDRAGEDCRKAGSFTSSWDLKETIKTCRVLVCQLERKEGRMEGTEEQKELLFQQEAKQ